MKTLKDVGEHGWIRMAKKICGSATKASADLRHGIGDDTALLPGTRKDHLLTTDMIVEGRHFRLGKTSGFEIGWKAMAVNLSDIAAMAGIPVAAVISLGAPASTSVKFLKELYRGLHAAAGRFGVDIVGGDTNCSKHLTLAVTVLGEVEKGKAVLRSGAKAGDWLFVSGTLGATYPSKKHLCFVPRVREARWLVKNFKVHAMMDLSDGLASDVRRICEESRKGVILNERLIPLSPMTRSVSQALTDGEDFELLFSLSAKEGSALMRKKAPRGFPGFTHVGWIVNGSHVEWLRKDGRLEKLSLTGFDHYR